MPATLCKLILCARVMIGLMLTIIDSRDDISKAGSLETMVKRIDHAIAEIKELLPLDDTGA